MKACEEFTDLLTITLVNTDGIANSKDYQLEICTPRLVVVCILLFTGWKGWEMVYRHRVGRRRRSCREPVVEEAAMGRLAGARH
jgi:hypothetical protein